ncbi:MAG: 30S ribosome-binding factor RbfA [Ignavibacteria bacterium]|nr:30S ribosome-binding factor RbfA [Ignavibacteria bacterium]MBT8381730.1 30S ribosome-binding factor RbfA [Ignavibacteria bacterium]MBT8391101.1 30S ribosome-binding factor RbfA [Ignavibacteria bacterium]NNJ53684.1 30S ribosome-binding factor RbfA [Ignavibacteriaceae bacterium]NNL21586.1 30S ribosome-binding factor RbfA [Ignavibacteriaceae bacterium]
MASYRVDKVEQLIKEQISHIFLNKLNNLQLGFVTITNVKVSSDLKTAKIYFSVLEKERRHVVLEKLEFNRGQIRTELAHRIQIKFVPELKFFIDDTLDYVEKIEGLLNKIHKQNDRQSNK